MADIKTGRRVILQDGTTYENATCGYAEGFLWVTVPGDQSLPAVSMVFFDPEKTATIVFEYGEMSDTYHDMTTVRQVGKDNDGIIRICLTK